MAQSLNQMQALGRMGKDPETRYTPTGKFVASGTIALNRKWRDGSGEEKQHTEWLNWEAWGKLGEIISQYTKKGDQVFLQGRIQTDRVEGRDGGADKFFTKLVALEVVFCGGRRDGERVSGNEAEVEQLEPSVDDILI